MENNDFMIPEIDKSEFELVKEDRKIFDQKFETKPIGYYKDAWGRFKKNKASLVAACIILIIILFSVLAPLFSSYTLSFSDPHYAKTLPKMSLISWMGIADGTSKKEINTVDYDYYVGIGIAAEDHDGLGATVQEGLNNSFMPIIGSIKQKTVEQAQGTLVVSYTNYFAKIDSYKKVGFVFREVSLEEYNKIRQYEKDNDINIIYPMCRPEGAEAENANIWYDRNKSGTAVKIDDKYVPLYEKDTEGNIIFYRATNSNGSYGKIRVLYYNYYIYQNGEEPGYLFGANAYGEDIFIRLAVGCRTSLMLAFSVAIICFIIGAIIGALEGYYGGALDMIIERILDILAGIPFIVLASLFRFHFVDTGKASPFTALLFAFVLTGWLGTAGLVRRQFYRFKRQEYVLAARTLGAKDRRLMFKHIFPNTLGTIITSSVLVIPGVIFTESSLAYLKIMQISGSNGSSIGAMLSDGQNYLRTEPHIVFFPALIISLLMISFNLFGNGLRDAFNPALRGVDD